MAMKFKVKVPKYDDGHGTIYKRGETVESDLDLSQMWANAFERQHEAGQAPLDPAQKKAIEDAAVERRLSELAAGNPKLADLLKAEASKAVNLTPAQAMSTVDPKALAARGTDVTAKYPKVAAMPEGFKVYRRGDLVFVYVGDALTPINEKGVEVAAVQALVDQYLG